MTTDAAIASILRPVPDWLTLNPDLDLEQAAVSLSRTGRLHLPSFLAPEAAERVHASLTGESEWARSIVFQDQPRDFDLGWLAGLTAEQRAIIDADVNARARRGFQYSFDNYRLSSALTARYRQGWAVESVYDLLNSAPFLQLIRRITGDERAVYLDAQATRYRPGHFLTLHTDDQPGQGRLYAYVLNFTKGWRADWGGLLAFVDGEGHVEQAWTPAFNALNIFRVPMPHLVTPVSAFAGGDRLSITGWVRSVYDKV